jgi:hypothetical protein
MDGSSSSHHFLTAVRDRIFNLKHLTATEKQVYRAIYRVAKARLQEVLNIFRIPATIDEKILPEIF